MNFLPLCTAMVCPTNSGVIVDLRDQVFTIFFSPAAFMASTFFMRLPSIKGPFLTDLGTVPSAPNFGIPDSEWRVVFPLPHSAFPVPHFCYLLFVLLVIIYLFVTLLCLVFVPSGRPQGEQPGLPPD